MPVGLFLDRKSTDSVPLSGVFRINREASNLGIRMAAFHILDDSSNERFIAEVLVPDVTQYADGSNGLKIRHGRTFTQTSAAPLHSLKTSFAPG